MVSTLNIECPGCKSLLANIGPQTNQCAECRYPFEWDDDILVLGNDLSEKDFPAEVYSILYESVDKHFWYKSRDRTIASVLQRAMGSLQGARLLDVGCGTGQVLAILEKLGMGVCGLDMHLEGLRYARKRTKAPLVCFNAAGIPFVEEFDAVTLCDVLEHVEDEPGLLQGCRKALRPGGLLLITVPASMRLWSVFDELDGHKRRYTKRELGSTIEQAGFSIEFLEYFNSLLFPFQYLYRKGGDWAARRRLASLDEKTVFLKSHYPPPALLNSLFSGLLWLDRNLFGWLSGSFGTSLLALARREPAQNT